MALVRRLAGAFIPVATHMAQTSTVIQDLGNWMPVSRPLGCRAQRC